MRAPSRRGWFFAVHDGLPRGVPAADNEAGWRSSLAKLAALVEAG
jgi:hypothetical protein